jgi:flavin-dependent dehydrogenase
MSTWRPTPAQGRVLLAGDAASLVNPLSGEGIFYALSSGRLAGITAVTAPDAPAGAYQLALRRLLSRHLRHTGVLARLIRHPPFVTAALRAAATSPAVHASMVELALGLGTMAPGVALSVAGAYARSGLPRRGPPGRDLLS